MDGLEENIQLLKRGFEDVLLQLEGSRQDKPSVLCFTCSTCGRKTKASSDSLASDNKAADQATLLNAKDESSQSEEDSDGSN